MDIPEHVVRHLRFRNQRHFGQAEDTITPLSDDLGFDGQRSGSEQILRGVYDYSGNDCDVEILLKHLNQIAAIEKIETQPHITEKDFRGSKLQAWRESTTTSPSGLHLGHYKAMTSRHKFSNIPDKEDDEHKEKRERINRMQQEIFEVGGFAAGIAFGGLLLPHKF